MTSRIAARRLISANKVVDYPLLSLEDGRIRSIEALTRSDHELVDATHRFPDATRIGF